MSSRAILDLCQLSDSRLFEELAAGLDAVFRNAERLRHGSDLLADAGERHLAEILAEAASEEAGKYLLLVDAARAPKDRLSKHLRGFYSHLAKGIYVEVYDGRPASFGEVRNRVESERASHYLDGPNDVDWIFENRIQSEREDRLYVDYVEEDGRRRWNYPRSIGELMVRSSDRVYERGVMRVARTLHALGCDQPGALETIANLWRPIEMTDAYHWGNLRALNYKTLSTMAASGQLRRASREVQRVAVDDWLFPLCGVDLSIVQVPRKDLEAAQAAWTP